MSLAYPSLVFALALVFALVLSLVFGSPLSRVAPPPESEHFLPLAGNFELQVKFVAGFLALVLELMQYMA